MIVRAGSTIVLQMHYTPSGKDTTDRTRVGFIFAKQAPEREMRLGTLVNGQFTIPAGAADHVVKAEMTTSADVTLRSLLPHTHLRGKSWEYTATYPDGRSEVILSVPQYDFNWQTEYIFARPLNLPKGTTIRAVAHYDNSAGNKDESRSVGRRRVGRSDVGGDDVHGVRVTPWTAPPPGRSSRRRPPEGTGSVRSFDKNSGPP